MGKNCGSSSARENAEGKDAKEQRPGLWDKRRLQENSTKMTKASHEQNLLMAPPLDYSFKYIINMEEVDQEEPRFGTKRVKRSASGKYLTQAIRLNNNTLSDIVGFDDMIMKILEEPTKLRWIDLSFNDLSIIDPVLIKYDNLLVLNFHGNSITDISEVNKLASLSNLKSLTLHGNPIDSEKGYRHYVLSLLPGLKTFDFSGVTRQDRVDAEVWKKMYMKPKKKKRLSISE